MAATDFERDLDSNIDVVQNVVGYRFDTPDFNDEFIDLKYNKAGHKEIILRLIEKHKRYRERMISRYERYKTDADAVPVFYRSSASQNRFAVDNRVNTDFMSEIVDMKTGYFAGLAPSYSYDKQQPEHEQASQLLADFIERNRIADINMETTKISAISGYAGRLVYLDKQAKERIKYIPAHQVILLSEDGGIIETEYAMRYYGSPESYTVDFYDSKMRYKYQVHGDKFTLLESAIHGFKVCPLFGYPNNDELMGDADKVLADIDAYDRVMSDVNSEIEAFRLAYLLITGVSADQQMLDEMVKNGALNIPGEGKAAFLEKNLNDTIIENHLKRLHDTIYRASGTPDLSDAAFGGTQSGEAMKFKLIGLETKCSRFEQKFKAADTRMFEVLATKWETENIVFQPFKVFSEFKRNFPKNLLNEADVLMKLKGSVSEETRLAQASFVDDVKYELARMDADRKAYAELYPDIPADTTQSSGSNNETELEDDPL